MKSLLSFVTQGVAGLLFPDLNRCALCRAQLKPDAVEGICRSCLETLTRPLAGTCQVCARSSARGRSKICSDCERNPPHFRRCVAAGKYEGGLRQAIHRFKYQFERRLAGPLGYLLAVTARAQFSPDYLAVAVPLYKSRQRMRGYNHSEILAWEFTRRLGWDAGLDVLNRIKDTGSQAKLDNQERRENVLEAFLVTDPSKVTGRKVLLLDDVITTGSTLSECARVLKLAGAREVDALVLASTDRRS